MKHRMHLLTSALSCTAITVVLTGCGLGVSGTAAKSTPTAASFNIGGNLHGGQQTVTGSTVKLWAAGVTGTYGTAPTLIATTTSDGNGNFGFDNTAGVSPCTPGQYLYLTAQGGNSGSGVNTSLAMMAALPTPCSATTGQQFITMNELTTVAAVHSLQQFMTINPAATGTTPPWAIGAPSTNITGMANAFLTSGTLANANTGTTATSSTSNAVSSTVGGVLYTTIVNPDFTKINTLADILASCVNSNGTACSALFADTTPSGATTATDTIDVAYYLATNAAGLTMNAHGDTAGSPNYLCNNYVTASAPFQPTSLCSSATASPTTTTPVPADWMIGVSFKTTAAGATAAVVTLAPGSIGVDAAGNVWTSTSNAVATGGSIGAVSTTGQVVVAPVTTTNISTTAGWSSTMYTGPTANQPFGGTRSNSLAIDTAGNAWVAPYYTAALTNTGNTTANSAGTTQDPLVEVSPTGTSTGYLVGTVPTGIVIDGNNNIYFGNVPNLPNSGGSRYFVSELVAAAPTGGVAYSTFNSGTGRGTAIYGTLAIDSTANQYVTPVSSSACQTTLTQTNNSSEGMNINNASTNTGANVITLATATCLETGVAADAKGNIWGANGYLEYIDTTSTGATAAAPYVSQFAAGTGTTQGGLDAGQNIAIDGLGNVWIANKASSSTGGVSEFTPTTTSAGATTIVAKSPAALATYGFGATYGYSAPVGVAIDASGNVWVETSGGSYLNFLVGAAAPVVTPNALSVKNGKIGVRP